ncbi:MAG: hypothetical protein ACJ8F1_21635 [Polyangia bacterium]|jgi:hypothetical protein
MASPKQLSTSGALLVALLFLGLATGGCAGRQAGAGGGTGGASGAIGTGGSPLVQGRGGGAGTRSSVVLSDGGQLVGCDGGDACMCPPFKLAVIGKPGKWGANPNGDPDTALQDWLNSSSAGTAQADNFTTRPTLTADFLAQYSVIILASLADDSNTGPWWKFSADEIAAFHTWLDNGGGVITLAGYSGDPGETTPLNQLIGFSGVTYSTDGTWGTCADNQTCSCTHSNTLSEWNRTDPVVANLATGVTFVGYQNGRSIIAPSDGHVAATVGGTSNALVGKLVGKGRVLAFGDEWITYTSQWTGAGNPSASDPNCAGYLPQDKYQMAQFWYNMIHWVQPAANCFMIVGPSPIIIWVS